MSEERETEAEKTLSMRAAITAGRTGSECIKQNY